MWPSQPQLPLPIDTPRFHADEELALELPAPLLDWVRRAAVAPPRSAPINHSAAHRQLPSVVRVSYYDNYNLPSAIRVQLGADSLGARTVVLRRGSRHGSVDLEATAFQLLAEIGLPAPAVLAGPCSDIPGELHTCMLPPSSGGPAHAGRLLGQALDRLLECSGACHAHPLAGRFPTLTLQDELKMVERNDGGAALSNQ
jgi:hypothetical protein